MKFMVGMAAVTVLSFTWFVGGMGHLCEIRTMDQARSMFQDEFVLHCGVS